MTTIDNLTLEQVQALCINAAQAGDLEMVADCELLEHGYYNGDFNWAQRGAISAARRIVACLNDAAAQ